MSNLEDLLRRNVAGKNGGPVFYPGEPDPSAKSFAARAAELLGGEALHTVAHTQGLLLTYLIHLYRTSTDDPARGYAASAQVRDDVKALYEANRAIASPLFLAFRFLIRRLYGSVQIAEPALELGMGAGDTAKAILGERKLAVGTTPIIDEVKSSQHNYRNHRAYLAADAARIPFADATFNSVVMNYTFYHLEDPTAACREAYRVLAPGGRFIFNHALRGAVDETRVLPALFEGLGLNDYARTARGYVFVDYGGSASAATAAECRELLAAAGFTDVVATPHVSKPLSRLIWLWRDLQIATMLDLQKAMEKGPGSLRLEADYRRFVVEQIVPLLSHDAEICARDGGTYLFFVARKPGDRPVSYSDGEIATRMTCPRSGAPLRRRDDCMIAPDGRFYPIYEGIPLLIPAYAEIWREQNAGRGDDPARWRPFAY